MNNERGFTLIEALASIVILGFVILTFSGFYFQAALFSAKNNQKYDAHYLVQKVVNIAQEKVTKVELIDRGIIDANHLVINSPYVTQSEAIIEDLLHNDIYDGSLYTVTFSVATGEDELILLKVEVVSNTYVSEYSETYTYVR
jgi:prepilin-type N-terminal cleavage/methylation domain-containing protein